MDRCIAGGKEGMRVYNAPPEGTFTHRRMRGALWGGSTDVALALLGAALALRLSYHMRSWA